jgi:putative FmdB family regulatory protein
VPLYEYRCKDCGHQFEKIQSFSAPDEKECPVCKGPLERLISASAIQFKGSGWYVNDYAAKPKGGGSSMKASADGDSKSSDSKSDSKSGDKPASTSSDSSNSSSSKTSTPSTTKND